MKYLIVILLTLLSTLTMGQNVSAPESKSFLQSTNGQDASGFSLSGFGSNETLLASISLINPPTGTTFNLVTTTGLTAASGFTLPGNKTRLVVTGTMANINIALASLKVNTGSVKGNVQLSVAATVNPAGFFYNGTNGHFYRPITATNERTTYTNARSRSLQTTFKGQTGYLVTITSADEDTFIFNNVPAINVWFAATDEVVDGRWVIDAGPEKGTVMKTQNGQTNGNIPGVYNNWAGGEPNGANGSENYAVAKWNGAASWNDLSNNWNNPYVIEYGTWTNPDDATFTEFYTNSVIHSNGDVLRAQFNFDFGTNIDETKFGTTLLVQSNNQYLPTTNTNRTLNGLGRVDMTNDLDTVKISNGKKGNIIAGGAEWSYVNISNGVTTLYIDLRKFDQNTQPSDVKRVSILDAYDGEVTYQQTSLYWAHYIVPSALTKITDGSSSFVGSIRNSGYDNWAFACEVSFNNINVYKPHGVRLSTTNNINSLYNSIVTVSDVFLAFRELSNSGLLGNESGLEFTNGVQFMNADVDGNNVFNEIDTYNLLQHLTGEAVIGNNSTNLSEYVKMFLKSDYDAISKSNWSTYSNNTNNQYTPISLSNSTLLNNYNLSITWKGDVNLSHSALQSNVLNRVDSNSGLNIDADIWSEVVESETIVEFLIDPRTTKVSGLQFILNYDNTKLEYTSVEFKTSNNPINFASNRGDFISLGSLLNGGGSVEGAVKYTVRFKNKQPLLNSLGLVSIGGSDAISNDGFKINITFK